MKVEEIIRDAKLVHDGTRIIIQDPERVTIAAGNWMEDQILDYTEADVLEFQYNGIRQTVKIRISEDYIW